VLQYEELDYTIQLPSFEGPLDVLLRLIERAELDITTIALAQVADQYLAHVRSLDAPDPSALSAFLVLAARLLVIKSRALLPRPPASVDGDDAIDDAEALVRQLQEYQRYKQVAQLFRQWDAEGRRSYQRTAAPPAPTASGPIESTLADMIAAVQRRLQLQLPLETAVALPAPKVVTVGEVAGRIRTMLSGRSEIDFATLLAEAPRRVEIVVTLWAVLEMLKRRAITAEQETMFGPIALRRGPNFAAGALHELVSEAG
jgi:segregation and condensation protein A